MTATPSGGGFERRAWPRRAALDFDAALEIGVNAGENFDERRPISFAMVIIILAFIPVFALTGMEGKMFHPLAFAKTFAMVCSTILAITLVPVLCTFLIRGKLHREEENPVMRVLQALYRPTLRWALNHRIITLGAALALFCAAIYTATTIGSEFMPPLDEETALFMPITDPRISLTEATEILRQQDEHHRRGPRRRHGRWKSGPRRDLHRSGACQHV